MSYTLGAGRESRRNIENLDSAKHQGGISAGRDEFGQWAIEPCELHRVYPALTHDTGTGNGTGERPVTGSETALAEANARAAVAEARLSDFKSMPDDIREQRDRWLQQAERVAALAITDQRKQPAPSQRRSWPPWLRTPTSDLLLLWIVGLVCGGVLFATLHGAP